MVQEGVLLPSPEGCPEWLCQLISECRNPDCDSRPTMNKVVDCLMRHCSHVSLLQEHWPTYRDATSLYFGPPLPPLSPAPQRSARLDTVRDTLKRTFSFRGARPKKTATEKFTAKALPGTGAKRKSVFPLRHIRKRKDAFYDLGYLADKPRSPSSQVIEFYSRPETNASCYMMCDDDCSQLYEDPSRQSLLSPPSQRPVPPPAPESEFVSESYDEISSDQVDTDLEQPANRQQSLSALEWERLKANPPGRPLPSLPSIKVNRRFGEAANVSHSMLRSNVPVSESTHTSPSETPTERPQDFLPIAEDLEDDFNHNLGPATVHLQPSCTRTNSSLQLDNTLATASVTTTKSPLSMGPASSGVEVVQLPRARLRIKTLPTAESDTDEEQVNHFLSSRGHPTDHIKDAVHKDPNLNSGSSYQEELRNTSSVYLLAGVKTFPGKPDGSRQAASSKPKLKSPVGAISERLPMPPPVLRMFQNQNKKDGSENTSHAPPYKPPMAAACIHEIEPTYAANDEIHEKSGFAEQSHTDGFKREGSSELSNLPTRTISQRPPMPPPQHFKMFLKENSNGLKNPSGRTTSSKTPVVTSSIGSVYSYATVPFPVASDKPEELYDDLVEITDEARAASRHSDTSDSDDVYDDCTEIAQTDQAFRYSEQDDTDDEYDDCFEVNDTDRGDVSNSSFAEADGQEAKHLSTAEEVAVSPDNKEDRPLEKIDKPVKDHKTVSRLSGHTPGLSSSSDHGGYTLMSGTEQEVKAGAASGLHGHHDPPDCTNTVSRQTARRTDSARLNGKDDYLTPIFSTH
ncbi:hypothetical protein V1264_000827 [Littorina saxatilis]|uniref:Uncharacterized protein n=1 Tax=Littorina saxatilis TaxID=31220 RepID=A0AAN9BY37_9CAEN